MPIERFEALLDETWQPGGLIGWGAGPRGGLGQGRGDAGRSRSTGASVAHAAMLSGDWAAAADAFGDVGWTYDRALMLSLLDDEEALTEAIAIARDLGAGAADAPRRRTSARPRARCRRPA